MGVMRWMKRMQRFLGPDWPWVSAQAVLLMGIAIAGPVGNRRHESAGSRWSAACATAGALLMLSSAAIALRATNDLSSNFTMSPTPVNDGRLVDQGIYGVVRHPMYLSVLLAEYGYALAWRSSLAGLGTLLATGFFAAKTRHEERRLREQYPHYADYAERVPYRYLPRIL